MYEFLVSMGKGFTFVFFILIVMLSLTLKKSSGESDRGEKRGVSLVDNSNREEDSKNNNTLDEGKMKTKLYKIIGIKL